MLQKRFFSINVLNGITVSMKLAIGFSLVLVLTAIVGGLSYIGMNSILDRVDKADDVNRMIKDLQEARLSEKNFIERGEEAYAQTLRKQISTVVSHAEDLKERFDDASNQKLMTSLIKDSNEYKNQFDQIVVLNNQMDEQLLQLRQNAQDVLDSLSSIAAASNNTIERVVESRGTHQDISQALWNANLATSLYSSMQSARLDEKNYVIAKDPSYLAKIKQDLSSVTAKIDELAQTASFDQASNIQKASAALELYKQSLEAYQSVMDQVSLAQEAMVLSARNVLDSAEASRADQKSQMMTIMSATQRWLIGVSVAALIIGLAATLVIRHLIVPPLKSVSLVARQVADGDLSVDIQSSSRKDEISQLNRAIADMVESLKSVILRLQASAEEVAASAEELSVVTNQTTVGVQEQKVEVDQLATAMHQMAASIQEVAQSAEHAATAAREADGELSMSSQLVTDSRNAIERLASDIENSAAQVARVKEESSNVSSVLDVIKTIADQTNLLALNAAIEAARAGDHGRGFAVVASEVRALAQRTQESTTEIENLIVSLQQGVDQAVESLASNKGTAENTVAMGEKADQSLRLVSKATADISDRNTQIATAVTEQSAVSEQVSQSIQKISDIADQSANAANETSGASEELARLSQQLQDITARFKTS